LGNPGGEGVKDLEGNIVENFVRLQEGIGALGMMRAWVKQVHGRSVEMLEREPEGEYGETLEAEVRDRFSGQISADGLVTNVSGVLLTIRVADCVPVLLASEDGRVVAGAHAGWRGVVGDVVGKTVRGMLEAGASAGKIVAAIGPCISLEHFEVGDEVAAEFESRGMGDVVIRESGKKTHVDLQKAVRGQLERAGVMRVDVNKLCTFRDVGDFFSHRRENGVTGRMAAVIAARA
jgi:polyphenol oxidase